MAKLKNFIKNALTDIIIRIAYLISGKACFEIPFDSLCYDLMFYDRQEKVAGHPEARFESRVYLREPQWHVDWSMKDD